MNIKNFVREMTSWLSRNQVRKVCALVAATLILPQLAHGGEHRGLFENGEHRWEDHDRDKDNDRPIPVVPEANAGWVLIPFFGTILLFTSRQFFRAKANQNNG